MLLLGVWTRRSNPFFARPSADRRLAFISIGQVSLFAGCALFTAFIVGGSGYVIREAHRQVGVAREMLPLVPPPAEPEAPFLITEDMFHVTSIALGQPALAMVNGMELAEGQTITVNNSANQTARVRVIAIADGTVTLKSGGQIVSVNLRSTNLPKGK